MRSFQMIKKEEPVRCFALSHIINTPKSHLASILTTIEENITSFINEYLFHSLAFGQGPPDKTVYPHFFI